MRIKWINKNKVEIEDSWTGNYYTIESKSKDGIPEQDVKDVLYDICTGRYDDTETDITSD